MFGPEQNLMKSAYPKLLALISILFLVSACKKGEDDPVISLRTRKARVEGKWRISEGSLTLGNTDVTNATRYNEVYVFKDARYTLTATGENIAPVVSSGYYQLTLSFTKKGEFSMEESVGTKRLAAAGKWDFNNGIGPEKKKESLIMSLTNVTEGLTSGPHLFNQGATRICYRIKELRNKKMVLTAEFPTYVDVNGQKQTFYGEFILIQ